MLFNYFIIKQSFSQYKLSQNFFSFFHQLGGENQYVIVEGEIQKS